MTSFLATWFSNLHILWNLPKAISLQSFSSVDGLGQVLQRDYKKHNDDVISQFWDSKFEYFVRLVISYQPAKCQITQLSESNFIVVFTCVPSVKRVLNMFHRASCKFGDTEKTNYDLQLKSFTYIKDYQEILLYR